MVLIIVMVILKVGMAPLYIPSDLEFRLLQILTFFYFLRLLISE